jgi:hypothetical protein
MAVSRPPTAAAAIRARRAIKTRRVREITGYDSSIEIAHALFSVRVLVHPFVARRLRVFDRSNDRANARERWDE